MAGMVNGAARQIKEVVDFEGIFTFSLEKGGRLCEALVPVPEPGLRMLAGASFQP
jgi:hypothetical protein